MKNIFITAGFLLITLYSSATALQIGGVQTSPSCPGNCDGTITLNVTGGVTPYSYLWNTGATTSALTGLCADTFTVVVTDAVGATATQRRIIRNPYAVKSNFSHTDVTCYGACNGVMTALPYGGTGPYTFVWSNGATTATISGLCPGTYTVTVADSKGCSFTCKENLGQPAQLVTGHTSANATCAGKCDGSANATATGGTTPYSYLWSNGVTTAAVSNLCAGNYTVLITDGNGCTAIENISISQSAALTASCNVLANESYAGAANGSMNVTANGGAQPYSYSWSNGATTATISGLVAGTYTVNVLDAQGCSASTQCVITVPQNCGGFRTQTQGGWGQCQQNGNNPGTYLANNFAAAFPNGLTVGCTYTLKLTSSAAVCGFLPSGTTPRKLIANLVDPAQTYRNVLAGQVVALTLNVGFDAYDANFGSSGTSLGSQVITSGAFSGWSVQQLLDTANRVLGGCTSMYSASAINSSVSSINENYVDGSVDRGFLSCPGAQRSQLATGAGLKSQVYPNPFNSTVNIMIEQDQSATITLMDLSGKVMHQYVSNGGLTTIAEDIKPGAYFIAIDYVSGTREIVKILKTN